MPRENSGVHPPRSHHKQRATDRILIALAGGRFTSKDLRRELSRGNPYCHAPAFAELLDQLVADGLVQREELVVHHMDGHKRPRTLYALAARRTGA